MTTRKIATMSLCFAALPMLAQTNGNTLSIFNQGNEAPNVSETQQVSAGSKFAAISVRFGYHDWKDSTAIDNNYGLQAEIRIALGDTPLDIDLRGHYANVEYDDFVYYGTDAFRYYSSHVYQNYAVTVSDDERQLYGGSAQLLWNFRRGEFLNPYLAAGVMYERDEEEYDWALVVKNRMTLSYLSTTWYDVLRGREKKSDDGTAFVGRVGLETDIDLFYARLEAAYVTELYDDDAQFELNGIIGIKASDSLRIDLAGTYFTEWKEYYVTAGLTFLL